jgi:hypothetical protein
VASAEPEVIVHQLTALSGDFDMRHIDRFFEATNRLRRRGPITCSPPAGRRGAPLRGAELRGLAGRTHGGP